MKFGNFDMVVDEVDVARGLVWGNFGNVYCCARFGSWRPSRRVRSGDVLSCFNRGYRECSVLGFATADGVEV